MSDNDAAAESPLSPSVRRVSDWDADRLAGLAVEHGTPLYVQDLDRVRENSERLREAFPDADVRYAVKAHTGRAVLEAVREAGLDAECASAGEVDRALAAGFGGDRLHYTAVNPPPATSITSSASPRRSRTSRSLSARSTPSTGWPSEATTGGSASE